MSRSIVAVFVIGSIIAIATSTIFAVLNYPIYDLQRECQELGIVENRCTEEAILNLRCPQPNNNNDDDNGDGAVPAILCLPPERSLLDQDLVPVAPFLIGLVVAFGIGLFVVKKISNTKQLTVDPYR